MQGASEGNSEVILEVALQPGTQNVIDLSSVATPERFRLVDCESLSRESNPILRIHEFDVFPPPKTYYSAISYVWRGNPLDPSRANQGAGTVVLEGAQDGDPIGVDVLRHACIASSKDRPPHKYIWLDRLCFMQTNEDDRALADSTDVDITDYHHMPRPPWGAQSLVA
ncbi:hypothetical protein MPER_02378 [Moniliophthora perniciosa FA553]|nr:hypothetical protein MPER_02378 [Moniliophthora perniciosa FA553]